VKEHLGVSSQEESLIRITSESGISAMRAIADRIESASSESLVSANGLVYDRQTLLHKGHIRDGTSGYGRGMLSSQQQRIIEEAFPDLIAISQQRTAGPHGQVEPSATSTRGAGVARERASLPGGEGCPLPFPAH